MLTSFAAAAIARPAPAQTGPVIRHLGITSQDGCPFCCAFTCSTTPTPTPELDGQGRRVYRNPSGSFLLVVEGGIGQSQRQPGSEGVFIGGSSGFIDPVVHASGRPSLQVLASRSTGLGSPQVDCRVIPFGGVPGVPSLDFNANVTTPLVDMACRFEMLSSSSGACTRDRAGAYSFLGTGTTRQYCMQVSGSEPFGLGDTILAVQLRDTHGNLGPRQEIVIRVDQGSGGPGGSGTPTATRTRTATPTNTPTPTPMTASVNGRVRYFNGDRPVPNATVRLTGAQILTTPSNGSGVYQFANMSPGTVVVEPRKMGDAGNGVTALDAAHVLQAVAGIRTFSATQRMACDVTGNGSLSALDGTRILQRQVGLLSRFVAADQCATDWMFEPVPNPALNQRLITPLISTGSCRRGAIALEPMVGAVSEQNFRAMLFGDCSGNWTPPASAALRAAAPGAHSVELRIPRFTRAGSVRAPITVNGPTPYSAVDLRLRYDADAVRAVAVWPLRAATGAMFVANVTRPGEVRIAVAAAEPIPAGVPLIGVEFDGVPAEGSVRFTLASVDDQPVDATP